MSRKLIAGAVVSNLLLCGLALPGLSSTVQAAGIAHLSGFLGATPSSPNAPTTLVLNTSRGAINVEVTPSTAIVRRYGGRSGLDELAMNDHLQVVGVRLDAHDLQATEITDLSIQARDALLVGQVTQVTATSLTVVVLRDAHGRSPFPIGETFVLPVSASTKISTSSGTVSGVTTGINPGYRVTVDGIFNRQSNSFTETDRVRVLSTAPVQTQYQGSLTAAPASVLAPTTLTIQSAQGPLTVNVSTTTSIVRRYGGKSGLDELSANDQLVVTGQPAAAGVVNATKIQDNSIQAAYSTLVGQILQVGTNSVLVQIQKDSSNRSPFQVGQVLSLPVGAATKVTVGSTTTTGSIAGLLNGQQITALGVFNSGSNQFISTYSIRVRSVSRHYSGFLVTAPSSTTAPATLVLQVGGQQVQVVVGANTSIVRRFNGTSGLDELSVGDQLEVSGQQTGTQPLMAIAIKDDSIQAAFTTVVGQVTSISTATNSITVLVQKDASHRSPLDPGQSVTMPIGTGTKITVGGTTTSGNINAIPANAVVTALGVYNRSASTFISTDRIRVHS